MTSDLSDLRRRSFKGALKVSLFMEFSAALNLQHCDEASFPGAQGEDNEGSSGSGGANLSCSSGRCSSVENIWICVGLMGNTDVQSEAVTFGCVISTPE